MGEHEWRLREVDRLLGKAKIQLDRGAARTMRVRALQHLMRWLAATRAVAAR